MPTADPKPGLREEIEALQTLWRNHGDNPSTRGLVIEGFATLSSRLAEQVEALTKERDAAQSALRVAARASVSSASCCYICKSPTSPNEPPSPDGYATDAYIALVDDDVNKPVHAACVPRLVRERDEARKEIEGLRRLKQSVDEALNNGDGVYRP